MNFDQVSKGEWIKYWPLAKTKWQFNLRMKSIFKKELPLLGSKLYGMPPMWAGGGLPRGSLLYKKAAEEEVGEPGVRTCKKKSCHTKDGVVIMYQFGYCWDLDVVAFEIKIPPFQFVWQWRACQGLPPAIGANYVRSRTKRISWSNDIVRDSFFSVAAALAILRRCNLLQLTKGGQRWRQQEQRATTYKKSGECESRSSTRQNTTVFLPFQSPSLIRVNTAKLGFEKSNRKFWLMSRRSAMSLQVCFENMMYEILYYF